MSCFDDHVMLYHILARSEFQFLFLLHPIISVAWQAWHINSEVSISGIPRDEFFSSFHDIEENLSGTTAFRKLKIHQWFLCRPKSKIVTKVNLIDKLHTYLSNYLLCKRLILHANIEICCSFKSFAGRTCGFSYREDRSCISQVFPFHSCKKDISSHLRSCKFSDPEIEVDPILSLACIFETRTDIDDFTICPSQRFWVGDWFQ